LAERIPEAAIQALLALVRVSSTDPFHRKPNTPPVDKTLKARILQGLERVEWPQLSDSERLDLLRVYAVLFVRMGPPDEATRQRTIARFDPHYPCGNRLINGELCQLLVFLDAPGVAGKTLQLLAQAPTQEEQMEYAKSLRVLKTGWSLDERKTYFS